MVRVTTVILSSILFGCASLPDNYSQLTSEQFLTGLANNNKPKIIPAKYIKTASTGTSMIATNYNVVGSYGSGVVLDGVTEATKLCRDKGMNIIGSHVIKARKIVACGYDNVNFIAIHYVSRENAGYDTGLTYAYFDHLALFDITTKVSDINVKWISKQYVSFENSTVDFGHVHNFEKLDEFELAKSLAAYAN